VSIGKESLEANCLACGHQLHAQTEREDGRDPSWCTDCPICRDEHMKAGEEPLRLGDEPPAVT
jgi:hypothetical protein